METDELWHTGPWPWKTTQPEAGKKRTVLSPFPSLPPLPFPSPSHQGGLWHVLDSHNPSPLCRSVPLPPQTCTHVQTPVCAHVGPRLPMTSPRCNLQLLSLCSVCVCVFVACCQFSSARDGERTGHCPLGFQHRERSCLPSETLMKGRRSAKAAKDVPIAPQF